MKKNIISENASSAPAILSQAIDTGSLVFVSGQIHNTVSGELVGDTVESKLKQIMTNIANILEDAQLTIDDIVKVSIFVTDLNQMGDINRFYPKYFSDVLPAREAVGVASLPLGATIEISVIASR